MPKAEKLIIDDSWSGVSGTGRYARELINRIKTIHLGEVYTFTRKRPASPLGPVNLALKLAKETRGVFWSPQYIMPASAKIPCIPTIHDLLQVHYGSIEKRFYFNHILRPLIRRSPKIITVSEFSRSEIVSWAQIPMERVKVVPNGLSTIFTGGKYRSPSTKPYFLYVGNTRSHKNIYRMLRAFSEARIPDNVHFYLSGPSSPELLNYSKKLSIDGRVTFSKYIDEKDLPAWYSNALALVNVSLYEGFGLPLIEAMGSNCPVISSNSTALADTAGNAALLVNPLDIDEIANAMEQVVLDDFLRETLIKRGKSRIRTFDWTRSSRNLLNELLDI